jgi:hypothetical protein
VISALTCYTMQHLSSALLALCLGLLVCSASAWKTGRGTAAMLQYTAAISHIGATGLTPLFALCHLSATYYGTDAWNIHQGSCGYGQLAPDRGTGEERLFQLQPMGGTGVVGSSMRFACAPAAAIPQQPFPFLCLPAAASWSPVPLTHS